jgi:hypothetical protein
MAVSLPNGSTLSIHATVGTAVAMSAITNATEAVATLAAAHGFIVGDIGRVVSGWSKLNGRVARIKTVATNDVTLEGINTSDTTKYPAGSGTGTMQEVLTWQQIIQVLEAGSSGGEQQFAEYDFLEDPTTRQIPTKKSAQAFTLTVADDAALPQYAVLAAADEDTLPRVARLVLASGSKIYWQAYVTMNKFPSLTKDQVMGLQVTLSAVADPTRYVS